MTTPTLTELDPFDLPEWLGEGDVIWQSERGLGVGHQVPGTLESVSGERLGCDLLAVDQAYPRPVVGDAIRSRSHQVWQHGEVLVGSYGDRLTLGVPGTRFDADRTLDAIGRLARAVGAAAGNYSVRLRIGTG